MRLIIFSLMLFIVGSGVAICADLELPTLHHIVGVKPSNDIQIPNDWLLNDSGEIDCKTCHQDADISDKTVDDVDKAADNFFTDGPFDELSNFCFSCHDKSNYERENIHQQIDANGKLIEASCTYCHTETLDPTLFTGNDERKLRLPLGESCTACHLKSPHLNAYNHLQKLDKKSLTNKQEAEQKHSVFMPLNQAGEVTCVTCHSPHQSGVIPEDNPVGRQVHDVTVKQGITYTDSHWSRIYANDKQTRLYELSTQWGESSSPTLVYKKIQSEVLLRLSARTGELCLACHSFGPDQ